MFSSYMMLQTTLTGNVNVRILRLSREGRARPGISHNTSKGGWTKSRRQFNIKQTNHGMFYANLASGVYSHHPNICPTVFPPRVAVCPGPFDGRHFGARKTNGDERSARDGIE